MKQKIKTELFNLVQCSHKTLFTKSFFMIERIETNRDGEVISRKPLGDPIENEHDAQLILTWLNSVVYEYNDNTGEGDLY